jgi:hypothetical protein
VTAWTVIRNNDVVENKTIPKIYDSNFHFWCELFSARSNIWVNWIFGIPNYPTSGHALHFT